MSISLESLVKALNPANTALLLGAGSSMPSGAPSAAHLAAELWRAVAGAEPQSDDLLETASILVRKHSRKPVVEKIISALKSIKPTGGLLGLPQFGWKKVYTTNFDCLIEASFEKLNLPYHAIRSNYDFTHRETSPGTPVFKIHGCITQDDCLGHKGSMLLTETDYEQHARYRQTLFSSLQGDLLSGDVLIIGHSLGDRHLADLLKAVLKAKDEGAPGHVYVLVFNPDDLRAPLYEDRGARIAFGGIDEFIHAMATAVLPTPEPELGAADGVLPIALLSTVVDPASLMTQSPNVLRMFNGGAATYADIRVGSVFERADLNKLVDRLLGDALAVTLTGAAGVGKTTFARHIIVRLIESGLFTWEHKSDYPLHVQNWIKVEQQLKAAGMRGVLFFDECTQNLRATNMLADHLASLDDPALRLLLTANSAQWAPRIKSANLFSKGVYIEISRLEDSEIHSMINLVEFNPEIAKLVHNDFKRESRGTQFKVLRQKCAADMFVCLKNIFANESLDIILLHEYEELEPELQDYYRYVAALEAVGMRVHRQLIIRMLHILPTDVAKILSGLSGIVDEYNIEAAKGIYGWSTRHVVIARRITEYKFSGAAELEKLFTTIIENVNPTVRVELQSIRDICDPQFGIGRLGDTKVKQALFRRLIEIAPAEHIPWHRLIRELLEEGNFPEAEYAIRNAEEAVGSDAPLNRYKVRLVMARAQKTKGISDKDRIALLRKAYEQAVTNTGRYKMDKLTYATLCDVAVQLVERGDSEYVLEEAITKMREAAERIIDPDISRRIRHYEEVRTRLRNRR